MAPAAGLLAFATALLLRCCASPAQSPPTALARAEAALASISSSLNPASSDPSAWPQTGRLGLTTIDTILSEGGATASVHGRAHYTRGLLLWKLGNMQEAVASLESAIAIEPRNWQYLDERGVAAGEAGDTSVARRYFRRAVRADPTAVRPHSNLAYALQQSGRLEEAHAVLRATLRLEPGHQLSVQRLGQVEAALTPEQLSRSRATAGHEAAEAAGTGRVGHKAGLDWQTGPNVSVWLVPQRRAKKWRVQARRRRHKQAKKASANATGSPRTATRHAPRDPWAAQGPADQDAIARAVSSMSVPELEALGAVFAMARAAEAFQVEPAVVRNFEVTALSPPPKHRPGYAAGALAVGMLGQPVSADDVSAAGGVLPGASVDGMLARLDRWGLALLPHGAAAAAAARKLGQRSKWHAAQKLSAARTAVLRALMQPTAGFSSIYATTHRYDYPLELTGAPFSVLRQVHALSCVGVPATYSCVATPHELLLCVWVVCGGGAGQTVHLLRPFLEEALGPNATLVEFACLASFAGAPAQNAHSDSGMLMDADSLDRALLLTVFVYLDDVDEEQAALEVWPGTHKNRQYRHGDTSHHNLPPLRLAPLQAGTQHGVHGTLRAVMQLSRRDWLLHRLTCSACDRVHRSHRFSRDTPRLGAGLAGAA
jgi:tetratricopeptide (TPR) repeat protein